MSDELYLRRLHRDLEAGRRARLRAQCEAWRSGIAAKACAKKRERLEHEQAERRRIEQEREARRERLAAAARPHSNVLTFTPPERAVPKPSCQGCFEFVFAPASVVRIDFRR